MPGLVTPSGPDTYLLDFSYVNRNGGGWKNDLRNMFFKSPVVVDAFAIARGVIAVLKACPYRTPQNLPQIWNEYCLFLSAENFKHLQKILPSIYRDLMPMLYEEMVSMNAVTVGSMVVRIYEDESKEVKVGTAILRVSHAPDSATDDNTLQNPGEITIRLDKGSQNQTTLVPTSQDVPIGSVTERINDPHSDLANAVAILQAPGREFPLALNIAYVIGREHPGAPPEHIALPNASSRINRRQVTLLLAEDPQGKLICQVTREPGNSNPVTISGHPLAAGQTVTANIPADLVLSGGDMRLNVRLPGGPGPITISG